MLGARDRAGALWRSATAGLGGERVLPGVLIIGTQRGGSTALYHSLVRHPGLAGARMAKEVHFFDLSWDRGEGWYRTFFPNRSRIAGRIAIEASPYYMFHPLVAARIASLMPDVRLIAMLRDPVARAISHHAHEVQLGFEDLSFPEAISAEPSRLAGEEDRLLKDPSYRSFAHQHHSYLARGDYTPQLRRYLDLFPRERLLVIRSEDFFRDAAATISRVEGFIGLTPSAVPAQGGRNAAPSREPVDPAFVRELAEKMAPAIRATEELLGHEMGWA